MKDLALILRLASRISHPDFFRISFRDRGAFYAVALAQRAASRSVNSPDMRLTTSAAPDSTTQASRPEISTCASMGTTDEPGACPATTWKVIAVFTRVPPWSSLPREETCPIIAVPSSSSATFARKVTWVGPNFTVRVVSYEPSSNRSPSFAPGTQSTTARGSDSTSHTIRGAAGTSTRSLISITMVDGGSVWGSPIRRQVKRQRQSARNKFLYFRLFN